MWLLDVNLPTALTGLRQGYDIAAETTAARGWQQLTSGALAESAARAGFRVLLTRDRRFGTSAGSTLGAVRELAIVIVTLPQLREAAYLAAFNAAWQRQPVEPVAGRSSNGHEICRRPPRRVTCPGERRAALAAT